MQIIASSLSLSASTSHLVTSERSEHLETWVGARPRPQAAATEARPAARDQWQRQRPSLQPDGGLSRLLEQAAKIKAAASDDTGTDGQTLDAETEKILILLEKVFGMKGVRKKALQMKQLEGDIGKARIQLPQAAVQAQQAQQAQRAQQAQPQQPAGWGMIYESHERTVETRSASLTASAQLTLDDGSQLALSLDWSQSNVRVTESSTRIAMGDAKLSDPLVLDLDGNGITFSAELASIDLDRDGKAEQVAKPGAGNALLVWDRNGDGQVQDGSEVVGAATGQAFQELAAQDGDGNGWIDSGDAIYGQLRLWDGGSGLQTLAEGGVAAISTTSVALPYDHTATDGTLQAVGRRGGIFVGADGTAGAALQVDLVA